MKVLYGLLRCPLCGVRASSAEGCCARCAATLFEARVQGYQLTLGVYGEGLERAVRAFKFHGTRRLKVLFAHALAAEVERCGWEAELLCAVPLHLTRRLHRGYNQSSLVARTAASALGLPYRPVLERVRATKQQARLGAGARQENVAGAFRARPLEGERVLLVDDVITSGATVTECSLALLEAGASRVYVAALARAKK